MSWNANSEGQFCPRFVLGCQSQGYERPLSHFPASSDTVNSNVEGTGQVDVCLLRKSVMVSLLEAFLVFCCTALTQWF